MVDKTSEDIENVRHKAFNISRRDKIGNVLQKSIDLLDTLRTCDADSEEIYFARTSLERERELVQNWKSQRISPLHSMLFDLTKALEKTIYWVSNKEAIRELYVIGQESDIESEGDSGVVSIEDDEVEVIEIPEKLEKLEEQGNNWNDRPMIDLNVMDALMMKSGMKDDVNPIEIRFKDEEIGRVKVDETDDATVSNFIPSDDLVEKMELELKLESSGDFLDEKAALCSIKTEYDEVEPDDKVTKKLNECKECGKSLSSSWSLIRHLKMHKKNSRKTSKKSPSHNQSSMKICKRRGAKSSRSRTSGKTSNRSPACDICGKTFKWNTQLGTHKKYVHEEASIRPFECDICGKKFKQSQHLGTHKRNVHEEALIRLHNCDSCRKKFKTAGHLKTHKQSIHEEATIRPFDCEICELKFKLIGHLKTHKKKVHGVVDANLYKFKWDVSERVSQQREFPSKPKELIKIEKNCLHTCDVCGCGFARAWNLTRHISKMHESEPATIAKSAEEETVSDDPVTGVAESLLKGSEQSLRTKKEDSDADSDSDSDSSTSSSSDSISDEED